MAIAGGGGGFNQRAYAPSTEAQGYDAAGNDSGGSLDPLATSNSSYGSGGGGVNGAGQNANWDGAVNASIPTNTIPGVQSYGGGADFNAPGGYSYIGLDGNSTGVSGGGGYGGGGAGSYASYTANETNLGGGAGGGGGYTGGYAGNNVTFSRGGTSYNTGSNVSPFSATNDGQGTITIIQLPVPSLTTTDASCNDTNDGTVNIVIPGYGDRTKPFIYKITTANGTSNPQSSNVFNNVPAGPISVEVTDNVNQPIIMLSGTVGFNAPSLALNITTDFNSNTDRIASSTLMANNKIFSPSKVTYKAGNSVSLNQGFEVKSGSTFLAQIGGCKNSILTGLVAYYPFNGNANDETSNGNHGVPDGPTLTTDRFGIADKAYAFDGIDDMIQVAASENLNAMTKTTISFWAYHNQVSRTTDGFDWQTYFSKDVFGKWFTSMLCTDPGGCSGQQPIILYHPGLSTPDSRYNWSSVSPNVWYHITVSNDGTFSKFYINGALVHTDNETGSITTNTSDLILGRCLTGSLYPLDGKLDDLRIYNRALSDAEIQAIYNAEKL